MSRKWSLGTLIGLSRWWGFVRRCFSRHHWRLSKAQKLVRMDNSHNETETYICNIVRGENGDGDKGRDVLWALYASTGYWRLSNQ